MEKLIDLSCIIEDNMPVYPGDSMTGLKQVKNLQEDFYNNHRLDISMHSGRLPRGCCFHSKDH